MGTLRLLLPPRRRRLLQTLLGSGSFPGRTDTRTLPKPRMPSIAPRRGSTRSRVRGDTSSAGRPAWRFPPMPHRDRAGMASRRNARLPPREDSPPRARRCASTPLRRRPTPPSTRSIAPSQSPFSLWNAFVLRHTRNSAAVVHAPVNHEGRDQRGASIPIRCGCTRLGEGFCLSWNKALRPARRKGDYDPCRLVSVGPTHDVDDFRRSGGRTGCNRRTIGCTWCRLIAIDITPRSVVTRKIAYVLAIAGILPGGFPSFQFPLYEQSRESLNWAFRPRGLRPACHRFDALFSICSSLYDGPCKSLRAAKSE